MFSTDQGISWSCSLLIKVYVGRSLLIKVLKLVMFYTDQGIKVGHVLY